MSFAIIVVDMQRDFFEKDFAGQERTANVKASLIQNINTLLSLAREKSVPIIFTVASYAPDRSNWTLRMKDLDSPVCIAGTEGAKIVEGLDVRGEDCIVVKTRYSGFYQTQLDSILQSFSIDTIAICGIHTHACVKTTIVDAFMRDYRIFVPIECVNSYDIKRHGETIHYLDNRLVNVVNLEELLERVNTQHYDFHFE